MAAKITDTMPMRYIYKIAPESPSPDTSQHAQSSILPPSQLDISSGFIHMSTASQVPGTLKYFFKTTSGINRIFLIRVELPLKSGELRWESPDAKVCGPRPDEGLFPHIYHHEKRLFLSIEEVESIKEVISGEGVEGWEPGLKQVEGWLF